MPTLLETGFSVNCPGFIADWGGVASRPGNRSILVDSGSFWAHYCSHVVGLHSQRITVWSGERAFSQCLGESAPMRKALLLICVLGLTCISGAQTSRASWANLSVLQAGQKIQIVDMKSNKHSGTFVNVSDTAISYQEAAGEQAIQKQDIYSVKLMENKHRLRNTLIGGAVGAGAGAGIGAAVVRSCSSQSFCIQPIGRGGLAGIGAAVGFAGGAIVGALLPSHKMIYRVNSH